jgi:predicted membrane channel-forming protein YqfA (hemolysin III family)
VDEKQLRKKRDQELIEILNEVRVALAGASVLFGFLLVVPFSSGWEDATRPERAAYLVAFLATLLSVVGLMTPTAYHRLRWRERNKERMLRVSHLGAVAGIACLAVAMTAATYLVIDEMARTAVAVAVTALAGAAFALVWFALPLSQPYERWDEEVDDDDLEEVGSEPTIGARVD